MFPFNMFPFNNKNNLMKQMNPQDIEKMVQNMISQFVPGGEWQGGFNPQEMMGRATSMFQNGDQTQQNQTSTETQQQTQSTTENQKQPSTSTSFDVSVFETFDDIYVRIPIKDESWLKQVKIFHTSNQAIIENIPEQGQRHVITLPSLIKKKGTLAQYKDEILEIKMNKNVDMQYTEVDVTEKL
ncbi:Hsp20/alpha crystallin family protein [Heyndrickxia sp. NPDC080065]|uniref:Hsp20/alpha crystallin family protein n=1 Tax=Heyndrickxia sp. NPDC080065 TaxID=3390568 RepID=UPI003D052A2C